MKAGVALFSRLLLVASMSLLLSQVVAGFQQPAVAVGLFSSAAGGTSCPSAGCVWWSGRPHQHCRALAKQSSSSRNSEPSSHTNGVDEDQEIIARRITVTGHVQGGYYRACVLNEAGRFRRLVGTMSPPDESNEAEIYVEGNRKTVEGFVRWCSKNKVGLSQVIQVKEIRVEEPTGLYDAFYVKAN